MSDAVLVHAADELYLVAGRAIPGVGDVRLARPGRERHRPVGRVRAGLRAQTRGASVRPGFFQSVEGAPALGYRHPTRDASTAEAARRGTRRSRGRAHRRLRRAAARGLSRATGVNGVEVVAVENRFFGGNIAVAGLLCGADVARPSARRGRRDLPPARRVPHNGRFLDGVALEDARGRRPRVATDGATLRRELETLTARK